MDGPQIFTYISVSQKTKESLQNRMEMAELEYELPLLEFPRFSRPWGFL